MTGTSSQIVVVLDDAGRVELFVDEHSFVAVGTGAGSRGCRLGRGWLDVLDAECRFQLGRPGRLRRGEGHVMT